VRFEILAAVAVKIAVFRGVILCGLVDTHDVPMFQKILLHPLLGQMDRLNCVQKEPFGCRNNVAEGRLGLN
jgi:hypothetical protein